MSGIFISYRRGDSRGTAGRLYDDLKDRFGKERVFRDLDAIGLGADYTVEINKFIESCDAVVVVIGNQWLDIRDQEGRPRLFQPDDLVRQEVAAALTTGNPVIPVLVEDALMPTAGTLPEELSQLARRNALPLSDARWDYDVGRLLSRLEEVVPRQVPVTPTSSASHTDPSRTGYARPPWVPDSIPHPQAPTGPATAAAGWSGSQAWSPLPRPSGPPAPSEPSGGGGGRVWALGAAGLAVVLALIAVVAVAKITSGSGGGTTTTLDRTIATTVSTAKTTAGPVTTSPPVPIGEPTVTLSRSSGPAGTAITVSGSGFSPNETVEITFHTEELATKVTDAKGAFSGVVIRVPAGSFKGFPYQVRATGKQSNKSDGAPFNVT